MSADDAELDQARVLAGVTQWLERAVIGLNLCPFARAPHVQGRICLRVSHATDEDALRDDLVDALRRLQAESEARVETTLLIHPWVLGDFFAFNQFLDVADACVAELGLEGELQVASFHPHYQFAGTAPDDIGNCTNRAPYPILHLLRESSITRAVDAIEDPDAIPARNLETLRRLGPEGWAALWVAPD